MDLRPLPLTLSMVVNECKRLVGINNFVIYESWTLESSMYFYTSLQIGDTRLKDIEV